MTDYIDPEDYILQGTLEGTLANHRYLQRIDQVISKLRSTRQALLEMQKDIEAVYAYHLAPF